MYTPHPPCFKFAFIRKYFEDCACCVSCSKLGSDWGERNRATIMLVAAAFSLLGLILSLISLIGVSTDADTVKNIAWNVGESSGVDYYVGLNVMVIEAGGETVKKEWDDIDCSNWNVIANGSDICDSCADATAGIISTVVVAFITSITTLQTDIQRSTRAGDLNCQKFMGMLTASLGMFGTLYSLSSYVQSCNNELPDETGSGNDIDWKLGPGFNCLLVATLLKPIDFIAHLIVPVVKPDSDEKNDL